MKTLLKRFAVIAAVSGFAAPAAAATLTFDFQNGGLNGNGAYHDGYSATIDDVTLNVTAGRYRAPHGHGNDSIIDSDCSDGGCGFFGHRYVRQTNHGLGVDGWLDGSNTDGAFGNDLITFAFDRVVDFTSIVFTGIDWNDDFDLFIDGNLVSEENHIGYANPFSLAAMSLTSGRSISFGADGHYDNFRIGAISVDVAPVPLPAGALLLLTGLLGFGALRRRNS